MFNGPLLKMYNVEEIKLLFIISILIDNFLVLFSFPFKSACGGHSIASTAILYNNN